MERQILSPMPIPSDFVLKKGSNMRSITPSATPGPLSTTWMRSMAGNVLVSKSALILIGGTAQRDDSGASSRTLSREFLSRFTKTCWIKTGSRATLGRLGASSAVMLRRWRCASISTRPTASATMSAISESLRCGSLRFTKPRMR